MPADARGMMCSPRASQIAPVWSSAVHVLGFLTNPPRLTQTRLRVPESQLQRALPGSRLLGEEYTPRGGGSRGGALRFGPGGGGDALVEDQPFRRRRRRRPRETLQETFARGAFQGDFRGTFRETVTAAFSSSTRSSPTLPVEEPGASSMVPAPANAARGVPGPSVSAATVAVARGDAANGLDIFLQCMSRRRLKAKMASSVAANGRDVGRKNGGGRAGAVQGAVPACNKFLRVLGDAGRIDDAVVAYEAMAGSDLRPTIVTFSTLISRAGACRRVQVAERFYDEMLEAGIMPDVQAMNSLINAFSKAGSPDRALKAFDEMSRYGVTPSLITFNSLIDACARTGDIDRARLMFSRLADAGLRPNDRTFSALIHSHAVHGQVDEAFSLLQEMRARGLVPNRVTYSALINACGRAGQLARAFHTLDEMCKTGIEPNVVTWTTLIDACGKGKELEWSFRLFKEMRERGTVPNGVTCSALMDACLKADELDLAFAVLEHMLDVGIEPTEVTYTSLLTQCARLGQAERAAVVLNELNRKHSGNPTASGGGGVEGVAPEDTKDPRTRGVVEAAAGDIQSGEGEPGAWRIDPKLESDLLKLFGQAEQVDAAFKVLEGMVARRESPDSDTWLLLLNAVGTAGELDKAVALMERSRAEGHGSEINELSYSALLGACGRAKKLERAFRIVRGMRDSGVEPTEATYLALMEVCRHSRDSKAALRVFEAMETEGVRPGVRSYTSLLKAISAENTLRTRAIQRTRMLETRITSSSASGGVTTANRPPKDAGPAPATNDSTAGQSVGALPQGAAVESAKDDALPASANVEGLAMQLEEGKDYPTVQHYASSTPASRASPPSSYTTVSGGTAPAPGVVDADTGIPATSFDGVGAVGARGEASLAAAPPLSALGGEVEAAEAIAIDRGAPEAAARPWAEPNSGASKTESLSAAAVVEEATGGAVARDRPTSTAAEATLRPPLSLLPPPASAAAAAVDATPLLPPDVPPATSSAENPALDNLFRVFLVFQEMRSRGVKPDLRAYNALVNTCADLGEFDRALGVVRQMVDDDHGGGLQPDAVTYTSLIKAAARASPPRVEEAEEIFATMQQRTNHFSTFARPTEVTYAHLMWASVKAGTFARALDVWRQQLSAGVAPGARSTRAVLAACWGAGDIATALEVYAMMRTSGIRLDNRSLLELVKLCRANDKPEIAAAIMRERSSSIGGGGNSQAHHKATAKDRKRPGR